MKFGILVITIGILTIVILIYVANALSYHECISDQQTITFDEFIKLEAVAPEKWIISDCVYYCVYYGGTRIFMKTYFDELRFAHAAKKLDKLKLQSDMDKKRAELIKSWQSDIDNYRSEYVDSVKTYINEGKIL